MLRAIAQRLLYRRVEMILSYGEHELKGLIDRYSSLPLAQHARDLIIEGTGPFIPSLESFPLVHPVITLLSTCQQTITDTITSTLVPASRISSLSIDSLKIPIADFTRIIHAFPQLKALELVHVRILPSSSEDMSALMPPSSLPCLQSLELDRVENLREAIDTLFPEGGAARLRSFTGDEDSAEPAWATILQRAGRHLEELPLTQWSEGECSGSR